MKKSIYDLKLNEEVWVDNHIFVRRVPGGWIYTYTSGNGNSAVFVPFNNEFQT